MPTIKKVIKKYYDVIPYLFFGVCTTLVNVLVYWLCAHSINMLTMMSTIVAWILAVLFAYITNRIWVFKSKAHEYLAIVKEIIGFFGCRFSTGVLDWGCMFLLVEIVGLNDGKPSIMSTK